MWSMSSAMDASLNHPTEVRPVSTGVNFELLGRLLAKANIPIEDVVYIDETIQDGEMILVANFAESSREFYRGIPVATVIH